MGVCRWLFGKDVLIEAYPFPMIDPILFGIAIIGSSRYYCEFINREREKIKYTICCQGLAILIIASFCPISTFYFLLIRFIS